MLTADRRMLRITKGKHAAYPEGFVATQSDRVLYHDCKLRRVGISVTLPNGITDLL
jgi:hypothetical protein